MRPQRWQPTRLFCPWDSPGKNTGVGCHFLLQCMTVKSESEVAQFHSCNPRQIVLKRIPEVFSLVFNMFDFIKGAMFLEIWKWSRSLDTQRWVSEQYWKWSSLVWSYRNPENEKDTHAVKWRYMKTPTPTLQSRVALGSFAGPFATGRLRGCAGAKCCRPAREIAFLQQEGKKKQNKKTKTNIRR